MSLQFYTMLHVAVIKSGLDSDRVSKQLGYSPALVSTIFEKHPHLTYVARLSKADAHSPQRGPYDSALQKKVLYWWIVTTIQSNDSPSREGFIPRDIQGLLPFYRAEGSLRRDMSAMADEGLLVRVGGSGSRRGYKLPTGECVS